MRFRVHYTARCVCGKLISERSLASRRECPKCGRDWPARLNQIKEKPDGEDNAQSK
jgi:predicted RNA-binding Zn-ribbon protein involved in translation (DUF1610 family)